jgi:pimeloyl-ACP methyl ester carboxylesterase
MPRRVQLPTLVVLLGILALACWPASSDASSNLDFIPCPGQPKLSCTDVPVPLDRAGTVPGTIALSVARKLSGPQQAGSALLALAGGPGQSAVPFGEFNAKTMAPALHGRDLLVFDQRGTGSSDPLSCPALEDPTNASASHVLHACAEQIGAARGAFTTQESVQDIEAIRQATGYEKLVLYGTSYGTKVAEEYAERYPQHVEALLLDSVVTPDGPEAFETPTFEAVAGVVKGICPGSLCAGITAEPLADLTKLLGRLRARPLSGSVYDGSGKRHDSRLDEQGLLNILEGGDLNPALRALLPAAVRSALHGDPDPLLRLQALSEGLIPNIPAGEVSASSGNELDEALFVTTTCEETAFPWQRSAPAETRLHEALSYLLAQPASDFAPFDARTALDASLVPDCDDWPDASAPPPPASPLPNVPTLILSGAEDLRTPTSNARAVAALIPDAQLEVVPFTGHSVVGSDFTGCAAKALAAFFSGAAVAPCTSTHDVLEPTAVTPTSISRIRAPSNLAGRPGRTLVAVLDTLLDLNRQVIAATLQADAQLPSGASFGGLHGGFTRLTAHSAILHEMSFVPGVRLTGSFQIRHGELLASTIHVDGPAAADGRVRLGSASRRVSGTLGGHSFDLSLAKVRLAGAGQREWPVSAPLLSRLGRDSVARGPLAGVTAQLP